MTRLARTLVTLAVAGTLPASAIVAQQPAIRAEKSEPEKPPINAEAPSPFRSLVGRLGALMAPAAGVPLAPAVPLVFAPIVDNPANPPRPPAQPRFVEMVVGVPTLPGTKIILDGDKITVARLRLAPVLAQVAGQKAADKIEQAKPAAPAAEAPAQKTTTTTKEVVVEKKEADAPKEAVKVEVKKAGAAILRRPVAVAANIEPQIQRFVVQIRPLIRSEVHMALSACTPTPEQRAAILAEEEKVLKDVARACAQAQMGMRPANASVPDPRKLIPEALAKVVAERVSPEQAARYKAESDAKLEFSRKVAVATLTSVLDDELMLSAEQRTRVMQAIDSNWKPAWHGSVQTQLNANLMVPDLPDGVIHPILDPVQRRVWDKMRKTSANYFYGNYLPMGNFAIEEGDAHAPAVPGPADAAIRKNE